MSHMDKLSSKVLDYMQSHTDHPSSTYYDFRGSIEKIAEALSSDSESVRAAVRFLADNGFVKYAYSGDAAMYFYLDHKGLHSREFRQLEARERWLERLYGFLIGVATSVIAELILRCFAG